MVSRKTGPGGNNGSKENSKGQNLKSVPTVSKQTKTEAGFVAKCAWKRTDANENNFS